MSEELKNSHPVPWLPIIAEAVAIVVSILLAFAIDAWWDGLRERQNERDFLQALAEELSASQSELNADQAARERRIEDINRLLAYMTGEVASVDPDTVANIIGYLRFPQMFTPPQAVLNELISSGGLNSIRSLDLRRNLLEYSQWLDKVHVNEAQERDFLDSRFSAFLTEHSPYPLPARQSPPRLATRGISAIRILSAPYLQKMRPQDLQSQSAVFGNLLVERHEQVIHVLDRYQRIGDLIKILMEGIEQELRP